MDRISAFMDGEANQREAQQALLHLKQHQKSCESWSAFHLIGDVMRGNPVLRDDFTGRFRSRLQREPTVLAPRFSKRKTVSYALSAAASLVAVAVVMTLVLSDNPLKPQAPMAAAPRAEPIVVMAASQPGLLPAASHDKIKEYLMAHQEFSPSTALQGGAPYVRTVSAMRNGSDR